jgi:GDPmannose 4,6-dehydratase
VEVDYLLGDYSKAKKEPDDYVIATGETHSIRELLEVGFKLVGIKNWQKYIGVDPKYYRPVEVDYLLGDYSKAKKVLGWKPKVKFKELVKIMLIADIKAAGLDVRNYKGLK